MKAVTTSAVSFIQTLRIELTCEERSDAYTLHNQLSSISHARLFQAIDEVINRCLPQGLSLSMPSLVLDIGTLPKEELNRFFVQLVCASLEKALMQLLKDLQQHRAPSSVRIGMPAIEDMEVLLFYLSKGYFPSWFQIPSPFDFQDYVRSLLQLNRQKARPLLEKAGREDRVRQRMAYQFEEDNIHSVIGIIEPTEAPFVIRYHRAVSRVRSESPFALTEQSVFKKALWYFILNYLLAERGSLFNKKVFLKSVLLQLSQHYHIEFPTLVHRLYETIETVEGGGLSKKNLVTLLSELSASLPDEARKVDQLDSGAKVLKRGAATADSQDSVLSSLSPEEQTDLLLYFMQFGSFGQDSLVFDKEDFLKMLVLLLHTYPDTIKASLPLLSHAGSMTFLHLLFEFPAVLSNLLRILGQTKPGPIQQWMQSFYRVQDRGTGRKSLFDRLSHEWGVLLFSGNIAAGRMTVQAFLSQIADRLTADDRKALQGLIREIPLPAGKETLALIEKLETASSTQMVPGARDALSPSPMEGQALTKQDLAVSRSEADTPERQDPLQAGRGQDLNSQKAKDMDQNVDRDLHLNLHVGIRDTLFYLLQYGNIPWWGRRYVEYYVERGEGLVDAFKKQFGSDKEALLEVLVFAGVNALRRKRFLFYFGERFFLQLLMQREVLPEWPSLEAFLDTLQGDDRLDFLESVIWTQWKAGSYQPLGIGDLIVRILDWRLSVPNQSNKTAAILKDMLNVLEKTPTAIPVSSNRLLILLKALLNAQEEGSSSASIVTSTIVSTDKDDVEADLIPLFFYKEFSLHTKAEQVALATEMIQYFLLNLGYLFSDGYHAKEQSQLLVGAVHFLYKADRPLWMNLLQDKRFAIGHKLDLLLLMHLFGADYAMIAETAALLYPSLSTTSGAFLPVPLRSLQVLLPNDPLPKLGHPDRPYDAGEARRLLVDFIQSGILPESMRQKTETEKNSYLKEQMFFLFREHRQLLQAVFENKTAMQPFKLQLYALWSGFASPEIQVFRFLEPMLRKDLGYWWQHRQQELPETSIKDIADDNSVKPAFESVDPGKWPASALEEALKEMSATDGHQSWLYHPIVLEWLVLNRPEAIEYLLKRYEPTHAWSRSLSEWYRFLQEDLLAKIGSATKRREWYLLSVKFHVRLFSGHLSFEDPGGYLSALLNFILRNETTQQDSMVYLQLILHLRGRAEDEGGSFREILERGLGLLEQRLQAYMDDRELLPTQAQIWEKLNERYPQLGKARKEKQIRLTKESVRKEKEAAPTDRRVEDKLFIQNAGLVLMHVFYKIYFSRLGLLSEDGQSFAGPQQQVRAAQLLQYLVTGKQEHEEYELALNKLLCGIPLSEPMTDNGFILSQEEIALSEELLKTVIERWEKIKNSSIEGFRGSFLQRAASLAEQEIDVVMEVEKKTYDVLIQFIPWSIGMVRLPWMSKPLSVKWI